MPQEWEAEFDKYRGSPEYVYKNADISMDDFKFIWSMEYGHRMWGRTIGAVFYIPAAVMWAKGFFNKAMKVRVVAMGTLLGFQGLLGRKMIINFIRQMRQFMECPPISRLVYGQVWPGP